jgi:hypothetical protein
MFQMEAGVGSGLVQIQIYINSVEHYCTLRFNAFALVGVGEYFNAFALLSANTINKHHQAIDDIFFKKISQWAWSCHLVDHF